MKKFLLTLLALLMIAAQIEAATPIKKHPRIAVSEFTNKAIKSPTNLFDSFHCSSCAKVPSRFMYSTCLTAEHCH